MQGSNSRRFHPRSGEDPSSPPWVPAEREIQIEKSRQREWGKRERERWPDPVNPSQELEGDEPSWKSLPPCSRSRSTGGRKVGDGRRPELAEGKGARGGRLQHETKAAGKDLGPQKSRASRRRSRARMERAARAWVGHGHCGAPADRGGAGSRGEGGLSAIEGGPAGRAAGGGGRACAGGRGARRWS